MIAVELAVTAKDRSALSQLNPLEAASVLAARAGGDAPLKQLCARIIGAAKRHSLQHALLAGLPFRGCVTTNFDELFTQAVRSAGAEMAILPADVGSVTDRWCLQLHGSVSRPSSLVLTRADYAQFAKTRAASEGVLQGLLLTQHVLFVGFSMRDENWCRIVETVRGSLGVLNPSAEGAVGVQREDDRVAQSKHERDGDSAYHTAVHTDIAAEHQGGRQLGTVLPLMSDDLFDSLWRPLLHVNPLDWLHRPAEADAFTTAATAADAAAAAAAAETSSSPPPLSSCPSASRLREHARQLEIFLVHHSRPTNPQRSIARRPP